MVSDLLERRYVKIKVKQVKNDLRKSDLLEVQKNRFDK